MMQPLEGCINTSAAECLNQDNRFPVSNIFQPNEDLVLKSDESVDHQLLVRLTFQSPVKLSGIIIRAPDNDEAPQVVKIFQNKIHLGFQDAESDEPVQILSLEPEMLSGEKPIQLRFVKFQNVSSVQLFFEENQGGAVTTVKDIKFFGQPAENMNMADFKPIKS
eukprot:GEMP01037691.1.p1 GENE.GEMP01037691.1~~GEMP01037691.1.p1  ORF type:complete len:164 (+),score=31.06 GEMP01037691.1:67-558(+)